MSTARVAFLMVLALSGMLALACDSHRPERHTSTMDETSHHLEFTGDASNLGSAGTFRLATDRSGRICVSIETPLPEAFGGTGGRVWAMDPSGIPRTLHGHERGRELLHWWSWSGFVLDPAFPGSRIRLDDDTTGTRTYRLVLEGVEARLTTNAHGRPSRLLMPSDMLGDELTEFDGEVEIAGMAVPAHSRTSRAGITIRRLNVTRTREVEELLECTPPRPPETQRAPGASRMIEVRRAPTGHLLVRPIVDGRDLGMVHP
jgi:hypothetical protein